jgi:hypothetical protein
LWGKSFYKEKQQVMKEEKETKTLLIFDKDGNYFCETHSTTIAAKITGGNVANIHRAANNGDLISTGGYYFITKLQARSRTIASIEKCLKIIIACNNIQGLGNRINSVYKIINNEKIGTNKIPEK